MQALCAGAGKVLSAEWVHPAASYRASALRVSSCCNDAGMAYADTATAAGICSRCLLLTLLPLLPGAVEAGAGGAGPGAAQLPDCGARAVRGAAGRHNACAAGAAGHRRRRACRAVRKGAGAHMLLCNASKPEVIEPCSFVGLQLRATAACQPTLAYLTSQMFQPKLELKAFHVRKPTKTTNHKPQHVAGGCQNGIGGRQRSRSAAAAGPHLITPRGKL